jgi:hypothetical protein
VIEADRLSEREREGGGLRPDSSSLNSLSLKPSESG